MDYIPGKPLDEAWDDLSSHEKLSIANDLHSDMAQRRALKGDYIGALHRGKAIIGQIASIEGGPFDSEQQFNEFILGDMVSSAPDLLRHYARFALSNHHHIVFTHADLGVSQISSSTEVVLRLSLTGNMLAGIRNIGNMFKRFAKHLKTDARLAPSI